MGPGRSQVSSAYAQLCLGVLHSCTVAAVSPRCRPRRAAGGRAALEERLSPGMLDCWCRYDGDPMGGMRFMTAGLEVAVGAVMHVLTGRRSFTRWFSLVGCRRCRTAGCSRPCWICWIGSRRLSSLQHHLRSRAGLPLRRTQ